MSGVNAVLSIARTALLTQQMAVEVTSHNVANVNTPGYSRQQLVMEPNNSTTIGLGQIGTGVQGQAIIRYHDKFMTAKVNQQVSSMTGFEAKKSSMKVVETLFNETTEEGLSKLLGEFWAAWHDLGNNPAGKAERATLVGRAGLLVDHFQSLYSDLMRLSTDMDINLGAGIEDVNSLTGQIADLNVQIITADKGVGAANDLRDKRDYLVRQLAELMDINYFEIGSGAYTIMSNSGHILVETDRSWDLELNGGQVYWVSSTGAEVEMRSGDLQGGKLGGWLAVKQEIIPDVLGKVNNLAESFIREVNSQHSQGIGLAPFTTVTGAYASTNSSEEIGTVDSGLSFYDVVQDGSFNLWLYDSNGDVIGGAANNITIDADVTTLDALAATIDGISGFDASVSGGKLTISVDTGDEPTAVGFGFSDDTSSVLAALGINTFFDGYDSGSIALNSVITDNTDNIAAGTINSTGDYSLGDNENALALADLQIQNVDIGGQSATFDDYYNALVGEIGITARGYNNGYDFSRNMVNQLSQLRDSVSGVSLDEEMTKLIQYQQAYSAAARLIQASDEMMQTLLSAK
ncbi:MAG: flagellar hook-associated protein FlgK [Deltaproteobacteria bacterium]|nr:MAG: flagellar hook-associated protein FlgK [Deltaproteobacteria bacterium]